MAVVRKVKYESELDPSFTQWVTTIPGGERIRECIQCGTCSGICPMSVYMDVSPRRLIAMADAGFKDEVLGSFTIWLCSSCYACVVNCPKDIKITEVMYALKMRALQEKRYPRRRFPIPILAKEFANLVMNNGRNSEGRLVFKLALKTNLLNLIKMLPLGWKLITTGRFSLRKDRVKNPAQIRHMMKTLEVKP